MRGAHRSLLAFASGIAALGAFSTEAHATGFTDVGQDITPREKTTVVLTGSFRTRGEALVNLDLDRGPTPSGQLLFPVPVDNVKGQTLLHADTRFRTDVAVYAPFGGIAVKSRIDVLDNLQWGSEAQGVPTTTSTQLPANGSNNGRAFRVKRAWAEASTPFGLLAVGRMGNQWGLGMLANGGDCSDCDSGDAVDRLRSTGRRPYLRGSVRSFVDGPGAPPQGRPALHRPFPLSEHADRHPRRDEVAQPKDDCSSQEGRQNHH